MSLTALERVVHTVEAHLNPLDMVEDQLEHLTDHYSILVQR